MGFYVLPYVLKRDSRKFVLTFLLFLFWGTSIVLSAQSDSETLATVRLTKTDVILGKEYNDIIDRLKKINASANRSKEFTASERKEILQSLINNYLILQAADRDRVNVTDEEVEKYSLQLLESQAGRPLTNGELRQILKEQGVPYEDFLRSNRNSLIIRKFVMTKYRDEIEKVSTPSRKEVEKVYNERLKEFVHPDMIRFRQVLVQFRANSPEGRAQTKKKAEDLLVRIRDKGEKIEDLAPLYSDDPESSPNGGDVNYIPRSDPNLEQVFGKSFFEDLFRLKKGEVKLLSSNVGYHIVQITDFKQKGLYDLDGEIIGGGGATVFEYLQNAIRMEKQEKRMNELIADYMDSLRKEAAIKVLYKPLQPDS